MDNIHLNNDIINQNIEEEVLIYVTNRVYIVVLSIAVSLFVADVIILPLEWNQSCSPNIKIWILVSICLQITFWLLVTYKYFMNIDNNSTNHTIVKILEYLCAIGFIGKYIWGWVWYSMVNGNCEHTHITKLMLTHLLINTITSGLAIILLLLLLVCGLFINNMVEPHLENNGLTDQQLEQLADFHFDGNGVTNNQLENNNDICDTHIYIENQKDRGCCICLEKYEQDDLLRVLLCKHHFHRDCCDNWLKIKNTCPLCRHSVIQIV
jgi:hypothetical protein